ncbi:hypothetical protein MNBD_ALPHA06-24, partial [hydrothermal vent metagenome]
RKETRLYQQLQTRFKLSEQGQIWMMVHPQALSDAQNQQLKQAIEGPKAFQIVVLVDPYREGAALPGLNGLPRAGAQPASSLPAAIANLGISFNPNKVVVDAELAAKVQMTVNGKSRLVDDPTWLRLSASNVPPAGPLQSAIAREMVLASAGSIEANPKEGWQFQPLLQSSNNAMLVQRQLLANGGFGDQLLNAATQKGSKTLAGLLSSADHSKQILILADTDFIDDRFYGKNDPVFGWQEISDNARVLLTAMDLSFRTPSLIALAPKGNMDRPLSRIVQMRQTANQNLQQAEQQLNQQPNSPATAQQLREVRQGFRAAVMAIERWLVLVNMVLFPFGFAVFGLFRRRAVRGAGNSYVINN